MLVVAIVVVVVALTQKDPPAAQQNQPPSAAASSAPALVPHQETLGFTISVPDGWKRSESTQGDRSDVLYIGPQPDPQVGAPEVQVRRDTTGTTARQYLANRQESVRTDRENIDYNGDLNGDQLEYQHGSAAGPVRYHVLAKAVTDNQNRLYVVTFTLHANDQKTLQTEWDAVAPVATAIFNSFKFTA